MATRQALVGLVLVVDARHGLADLDLQLLDGFLPSGRPVLVLATKMDKLTPIGAARRGRRDRARRRRRAIRAHAAQVTVVPFSATRRIGIEEAETLLGAWLGVTAESIAARSRGTAAQRRQAKKRPRDQGE